MATNTDPLASNSYNATDNASFTNAPTKVKTTKTKIPKSSKISVGTLKQYKVSSTKITSPKVPKVSAGLRSVASAGKIGAKAMSLKAPKSVGGNGKIGKVIVG